MCQNHSIKRKYLLLLRAPKISKNLTLVNVRLLTKFTKVRCLQYFVDLQYTQNILVYDLDDLNLKITLTSAKP